MPKAARSESQPGARRAPGHAGGTLVLLNTAAGQARSAEEQARLVARLREQPGTHVRELAPGTGIGQAAREAVSAGYRTVVAAGGDGTVSAVAGALAGSGVRMGVVPLGTFNFFARAIGLPQRAEPAIETLQKGRTVPLSVGTVDGQVFVNNASLGAYDAVLEARERIYGRWGRSRLAAYWSVLVALARLRRAWPLTVEVDGQRDRVRTPLAFVAVRPFQIEHYDLSGAAAVREGQLALFLAPESGRIGLLWRAVKVAMRRTLPERDYRVLTGREITIDPEEPSRVTLACDGERMRRSGPLRFRAWPGALTVISPGASGPAGE